MTLLRRPAAAVSREAVQGSCAYWYEAGRNLVRIRVELPAAAGNRPAGEQGSCA